MRREAKAWVVLASLGLALGTGCTSADSGLAEASPTQWNRTYDGSFPPEEGANASTPSSAPPTSVGITGNPATAPSAPPASVMPVAPTNPVSTSTDNPFPNDGGKGWAPTGSGPDAWVPYDIETFRLVKDLPPAAAGRRTAAAHPPLGLTLPEGVLTSPEQHTQVAWRATFRVDGSPAEAWAMLAPQLVMNEFSGPGGQAIPTQLPATSHTQQLRKGSAGHPYVAGTIQVSGRDFTINLRAVPTVP